MPVEACEGCPVTGVSKVGCAIDGGTPALTLATGAENRCGVLMTSLTTDGGGGRASTLASALAAPARSETDARFANSAADECAWLAMFTIAAAAGFVASAVNAEVEFAKELLVAGPVRISGPRVCGAFDVCRP